MLRADSWARWYAARLRAMGPREVTDRLLTQLDVTYDDAAYRLLPQTLWRRRWHGTANQAPSRTAQIVNPARGVLVADLGADSINELVERAVSIVATGKIAVFGIDTPLDLSSLETDPITGGTWPAGHGLRTNYRDSAVGDPKWAWEASRLQHLPLLAAAWCLTEDTRYSRAAIADAEEWIAAHPVGRGIAWSNGYEAALRAISLALTLDSLSTVGGSAWSDAMLQAIDQHVRWIERYPSLYSSANNHRIGELSALVAAYALYPELPGAAAGLARAASELEERCDEQFRADGSHDEEAMWYGLFSADLVLLAVAALSAAALPLPEGITAALWRFADFVSATHADDEPDLRFGDADDGRATRLDGAELRNMRGVCASLAAALGHSGARRLAGELDPTAIWLFGADGRDRFLSTDPLPEPESAVMRDAGLVVLRAGQTRVTFDAGPLGDQRLAAHGHADALAVSLSIGSTYVVGDPGTGTYFGDASLRAALRGTGAHATVLVDGRDQSEQAGAFLWGRRATARLAYVDLDRRLAIASHDGYLRLRDPVRHERAVLLMESGLLVYDRLDASASHTYSQRWPLPPSIRAQLEGNRVVCSGSSVTASLVMTASVPSALRVVEGSEEPREGWWSARFQAAEPAPLVCLDFEASGVVHAAAFLAVTAATPEMSLDVEDGERTATLTVGVDGITFSFVFDLDAGDGDQVVCTASAVAAG